MWVYKAGRISKVAEEVTTCRGTRLPAPPAHSTSRTTCRSDHQQYHSDQENSPWKTSEQISLIRFMFVVCQKLLSQCCASRSESVGQSYSLTCFLEAAPLSSFCVLFPMDALCGNPALVRLGLFTCSKFSISIQ